MPIRVKIQGKVAYLTDRDLIVGRGEGADLRIDDPSLSRVHASLGVVHGRVRLTDLASSNGTLVNGKALNGSQFVELSDHIEVGDLELELQLVSSGFEGADPAFDEQPADDLSEENEPRTVLRPSLAVPGGRGGSSEPGSN